MEPLTDVAMWEVVVGFLSATFVLPVFQQPRWTTRARALVTFLWSILSGTGVVYFTDRFVGVDTIREIASSILLVLVTAVASYHGFAKPTGIAPAIERATSPRVR
jgi:hypothetical protein